MYIDDDMPSTEWGDSPSEDSLFGGHEQRQVSLNDIGGMMYSSFNYFTPVCQALTEENKHIAHLIVHDGAIPSWSVPYTDV